MLGGRVDGRAAGSKACGPKFNGFFQTDLSASGQNLQRKLSDN